MVVGEHAAGVVEEVLDADAAGVRHDAGQQVGDPVVEGEVAVLDQ